MKKLERSRSDRILFGVCGGLGEYLGVDANLIRVVWILSLLGGGAGLLPYVAAIFLVPESEVVGPEARGNGSRILGFSLLALAGILFLRAFGVDAFGARVFAFWTLGVLLPLTIAVAGVFLVWPRARDAVGFSERHKPRRSVSDRVLAGVAGGMAAELNVDANLIRLGFVLLGVVTSGFAVVIYLLLVLVLPEEEIPAAGFAGAVPPGTGPISPPTHPASATAPTASQTPPTPAPAAPVAPMAPSEGEGPDPDAADPGEPRPQDQDPREEDR